MNCLTRVVNLKHKLASYRADFNLMVNLNPYRLFSFKFGKLQHNEVEEAFELPIENDSRNEGIPRVLYKKTNSTLELYESEVPEHLRGRGIGQELAKMSAFGMTSIFMQLSRRSRILESLYRLQRNIAIQPISNSAPSYYSSDMLNKIYSNYFNLLFNRSDLKKVGAVTHEEIMKTMKFLFSSSGIDNTIITATDTFFKNIVFEGKEKLTKEEFQKRMMDVSHIIFSVLEQLMIVKFHNLDKDKDGKLNKEETGKLLEELSPICNPKKADHVFEVYDKDKDGKITLDEMVDYAKKEAFVYKMK